MYLANKLSEQPIALDDFQEQDTDAAPRDPIADLFDPRLFRNNADRISERLEKYLGDASLRGLALTDPALLLQSAKALTKPGADTPEAHQNKLAEIIDLYIETGIQVYSRGYMGRQFSGAFPLAGIVDLVSSIVNQPASFYEAAQLPNVAERIMAEELNRFIGYVPERFTMVTTSGGSLANLTALLAARNDRLPRSWSEGLDVAAGTARPAIAVSADVHYSVTRAAGIIGIGEQQIVRLPINRQGQIEVAEVRAALDDAERRGLKVFCLVASSGTTSVGAFDAIDPLADIAAERDIWLHVDGAHGASLLLCDARRHRLRGIERADSLTWDAHKLLFVPAACTLLFYKNRAKAHGAFRQDASYVFEKRADIYAEFDGAEKNIECTKRPMIMTLWVMWALYGRSPFADKIDYLCRLTAQAHDILTDEPEFEPLHAPESNILCFRHQPAGLRLAELGDFQIEIRNWIRAGGRFFISKVDIDGVAALRVVFMNHEIKPEHVRLLLREIRRVGREILDQRPGASHEIGQRV
ncbi:MAG: Diaminobutyrate-pyruvate transaminase & L-2,4-diaminobutyrate decarboxylase [Tardiphaga sp.]|nr:Diaminobutyrate-pyruvate transaminase & L-2,4-diaminobutyrate decarboxylase [Tardiphaga sp.]